MASLYDQLLALQRIPHAYDEWTEYRASLTAYIIAHTKRNTSALIIGAGACNDFDMSKLADHFSQITLLDRNTQSIHAGLTRQCVTADHVHALKADLLGISDTAYRAMDAALLAELRNQVRQNAIVPERFEQLFHLRMQDAFRNRAPYALVETECRADYAICCGVHSQLLNLFPQMVGVYQRYIPFNNQRILAAVHKMNGVVAHELNSQLLGLAEKSVVFGLEKNRVGTPGGIEGAVQALQDIKSRNAALADETTLLWPFDLSQGKAYEMQTMVVKGCPGSSV